MSIEQAVTGTVRAWRKDGHWVLSISLPWWFAMDLITEMDKTDAHGLQRTAFLTGPIAVDQGEWDITFAPFAQDDPS